MLEKDKGGLKINCLYIICLYEADNNIFLKIMWAHCLVKICKEHDLFDDTQTGGQPNRTSRDIAVHEMLKYAYSLVTRTPFACMDLDANRATTGKWHHSECCVPDTLACQKKYASYMAQQSQ
jgi:hypothetical protein